jgi:hypothetical protein
MAKKEPVASVLTPEEREDMRKRRDDMAKETVAPPRGTTKKETDIFREGMKPPKNDEGPVSTTKKETPRVKSAEEIVRALRPDLSPEEVDRSLRPDPKKPSENIYKAKGGSVKSASARADGCAIRGKTRA